MCPNTLPEGKWMQVCSEECRVAREKSRRAIRRAYAKRRKLCTHCCVRPQVKGTYCTPCLESALACEIARNTGARGDQHKRMQRIRYLFLHVFQICRECRTCPIGEKSDINCDSCQERRNKLQNDRHRKNKVQSSLLM
jgi:hypothetical protein